MKLIVRADDMGYSRGFNYGIIDGIENGIITSVDFMVDMPGSEHAAELIKDYPAIALGYHPHMCGTPVTDPKLIPSLVDSDGKLSVRKNKVSRTDLNYDEVLMEVEAQVLRFRELIGHFPDFIHTGEGMVSDVKKLIAEKYCIPHTFREGKDLATEYVPLKKYEHLHIFCCPVPHTPQGRPHDKPYRPSVQEQFDKDVEAYFLEDHAGILTHEISEVGFHPGYLDDVIIQNSSYHVNRVKDLVAIKSPKVKQWIKDNNIELVSMTDAIFGTHDYQDYLKARGGL